MKKFNTTGLCVPGRHYMAGPAGRLAQIRKPVDGGCYFMINRARQYGKTTTLAALARALREDYPVVSLDFQALGYGSFESENRFSLLFAEYFLRKIQRSPAASGTGDILNGLADAIAGQSPDLNLYRLFEGLAALCTASKKPLVLITDEVDSAAGSQVFPGFPARLRYGYPEREADDAPAFHPVILAGVCDVRHLKTKLRPDEEHKVNSPWNIATAFDIDMSFHRDEIARMLISYKDDYNIEMDVHEMAGFLYDYTSGYPFLVSRLCQLLDERVAGSDGFPDKSSAWSREGILEAVTGLLTGKNTLFESLTGKPADCPRLKNLLYLLPFQGRAILYNPDDDIIGMAMMFGFLRKDRQTAVISSRIFETRLYNLFLASAQTQMTEMSRVASPDKSQFIRNGRLDMKRVLERFVIHFHDLYGDRDEKFLEEDGRRYFLLYLKPIINGTGNYYIEARTRDMERTDVIVDYNGEQFVIELRLWRGEAYNTRGEARLADYLDYYHLDRGYMLSFNFNQKKQIGVRETVFGKKLLVEAVV